MRHINISIADDHLVDELEAAAEAQGRSLEAMIADALGDWLRSRPSASLNDRQRELAVLRSLDEIRLRQPQRRVVEDLLAEVRDERS
jgi:hypothetical protein